MLGIRSILGDDRLNPVHFEGHHIWGFFPAVEIVLMQ
jgi:hypothetical protein